MCLSNFMLVVASTTVAETTGPTRCALQVVNKEGAAVPHLNVGEPLTTVWTPVKADLPGYFAVGDFWMSTIQPSWGMSSTSSW